MAFALVYRGEHYVTDIIVGWLYAGRRLPRRRRTAPYRIPNSCSLRSLNVQLWQTASFAGRQLSSPSAGANSKVAPGRALDSDSSRVRFPTTMRRFVLFAAVLVLLGGSAAEAARPGYAWHDVATGTTAHFRGLAAVSATTAWISGYTPTDGVVMRTTDGGATWQDVTP